MARMKGVIGRHRSPILDYDRIAGENRTRTETMRRITIIPMIGLLCICLAQAQPIDDRQRTFSLSQLENVRNALQSASAALTLFGTEDFAYDRWPLLARSIDGTYRQTLSEL